MVGADRSGKREQRLRTKFRSRLLNGVAGRDQGSNDSEVSTPARIEAHMKSACDTIFLLLIVQPLENEHEDFNPIFAWSSPDLCLLLWSLLGCKERFILVVVRGHG